MPAVLRPHHVIVLAVLTLLMLGVIMVNSADVVVRSVTAGEPVAKAVTILDMLTSRAFVYAGIAMLALCGAAFLPVRRIAAMFEGGTGNGEPRTVSDTRWYTGLTGLFLGVAVLTGICALVYVPGLARVVNGSSRWVYIPGADALGFQPSEIAKWSLVAVMALYCVKRRDLIGKFWLGLVPALAAIGLASGFIVLEDLGTGVLIASVASLVLLAGGAKLWHFLILTPFPIAGIVFAIITSDYRMKRITAFMNPYEDPEGIGYHAVQSLVAIANGGVTGRGLGGGMQKLGYLPEDRTDFIFAVLCEELGLPGCAAVVLLFALLLWGGYFIVRKEQSQLLRLMSMGIIATVGLQAVINLFVVTAMAPTKGIALPLISAGGTGWILTAFSLGVVVAVSRTQRHVEPQPLSSLPSTAANTQSEVAAA
ncbi:MAG: FtsW/RodA/SpoVE family cell cycle protein [Phycisphaerales bacterium]